MTKIPLAVAPMISMATILALFSCTTSRSETAPGTLDQQLALGASLYADECAHCHGDDGGGTKEGPPVVGTGALPLTPREGSKRGVRFETARDVADWMSKTMPGDDAGSLSAAQYDAILAFCLKANGVTPAGVVTRSWAATVQLH